jgi:hypothetical protein
MKAYSTPVIRDALYEYYMRMRRGDLDAAVELYDVAMGPEGRTLALRRILEIAMNLQMVSDIASAKFKDLALTVESADPEVKGMASICWPLGNAFAAAAELAFRVFINMAGIELKREDERCLRPSS